MHKVFLNNLYMLRFIHRVCPQQIWLTLLSSISAGIRAVSGIYATKYTLDSLAYNRAFSQVAIMLLLVMLIQIIGSSFETYFVSVISKKNEQLISLDLQELLYKKASQIELTKYDDPAFYDMYHLAIQNAGSRAFSVLTTFTSFVSSSLNILTMTAIIAQLQPFLFPIILSEVVFVTAIKFKISGTSYELNKASIPYRKQVNYVNRVYYLKDYSLDLRMFGIGQSLTKLFHTAAGAIIDNVLCFGKRLSVFYTMQSSVQAVFYTILSMSIARKILVFELSVGDFVALTQSSSRLMTSLTGLLNTIPGFYEHSLYIDSFRQFVEYVPSDVFCGGIGDIDFKNITLSDVYFQYPGSQKYALNNLNMKIAAGEKIAVVGLNGSGKSTLVKMIMGLYSPSKGRIMINDKSYCSYSKDAIAGLFGAVFQDPVVYQLSIAENILMRPIKHVNQDETAVIMALEQVGLYEKIKALPEGIYTTILKEIDENGIVFSGGELQKIAIARALACNASFLVLDEPSSALDPVSENEIFNFFFALPDKASIMISHRLNPIRQADRIYVLDAGSIVEEGSHEQLMKNDYIYAKMYRMQNGMLY